MRRLHLIAATALVLAVAGCSGSQSAGDTPSPAEPESSAIASSSTPTAAPSSATPVADCLNGRYRLVRFVGVGEKGTFGTGEGGDVAVTFKNGSYMLRGAGKDPIKLTLAGRTADLLVDGTIGGDYRVEGDTATFTMGESTGSATLTVGSSKESVSIADVGKVLAPDGEAGLSCANDALIVTLQDVRLQFGKV
ncbi:MAG TPA: hypothetical protein VHR39_06665 [Propionibacteriaceae bacterium]|nr:hypothetical protein [Propionibacteriaceae bacterium]